MNPAEQYILNQEEPFKSILLELQLIIEHTVPEAQMLFKYRIPFYYLGKRPFCYLNCTKGYVDVGFWNAAHLSRHIELMETAGRQHMRSLRYKRLENIQHEILVEVLQDAYSVRDKKFYK